jgi:hypothetical protein
MKQDKSHQCLLMYTTSWVFLNTMIEIHASCKQCQINLYSLPVLLYDKLLTSHQHFILSFIFKSKFCFIATIRVFQNFAVGTNQNTIHV